MELGQFLHENKEDILERWTAEVLSTYSADAARIFGRQLNRFANPIGYNVRQGLLELYDAIAAGKIGDQLSNHLEELVKIRAVQAFTPSESVAFVFYFKRIVRAVSGKSQQPISADDLATLDGRVDAAALSIFDCYMDCRERLHQVRIHELESNRFIYTDLARCPSSIMKEEDAGSAKILPMSRNGETQT